MENINFKKLLFTLIFSFTIWFLPVPVGLKPEAIYLLAVFLGIILGIILKAAPMGTLSMLAIAVVTLTGMLAPDDPEKAISLALSGFSNTIIWFITVSVFIARGFIKSGLGTRIAYFFIKKFGRTPLGLAYSLSFADFILAPAIPGNTARAGGIIYPIMQSIADSMGSTPDSEESRHRIGTFLTLCCYNATLITSAIFLTGTSSNLMCQKFAADLGISISWGYWALAGIFPGIISLFVTPVIIKKIVPPQIKSTHQAVTAAAEYLKKLGPLQPEEKWMVITFLVLLFLWIAGPLWKINATTSAFVGLALLLLTQVLTWEDVKKEQAAWDSFIWFSALVMMASGLNTLGFFNWLGELIKLYLANLSWLIAFPVIVLVYFYSHYLFASATAHVAAMYAVLLGLGVSLGVPGTLLALMLGFTGSLYGTLTQYGHGPAPVLFGSGYVTVTEWWKTGFLLSVSFLLIWLVLGGVWWKVIGVF
ncbi:anion permease [Adhaeribacter arboris]|uniref:Anion permease n=1 Tax=Adhaeribacter arboris TaxID=2072846 RepID=A0A2T2YFI5_9BACT|nr:anion permease [Adhaeribacter arboris]PSR54264.1 anion permease [Adhaeribacter arboris]